MNKKHNKNAYRKDILRNIKTGKKRFFAIAVITSLGVMMFSGLEAACEDLRRTADELFDEQNLHDLTVVSTLGLTDEDVAVLQALDGIETAVGAYSEDVSIHAADADYSVELQVISEEGIDAPLLLEGRLPQDVSETVITQLFESDTSLTIGDTFTVNQEEEEAEEEEEEDGEDSFDIEIDTDEESSGLVQMEYTIVGIVLDPTDVDNPLSTSSFRTTSTQTARAFILPDAVDTEVYTAVHLIVEGAAELWCYSDAYEDLVGNIKSVIEEEIKEDREEARTNSIKSDAQKELDDASSEAKEELSDALKELTDGEAEMEEELSNAREELYDAQQEVEDGWAEIEDAKEELEEGKKELADSEALLDEEEASALSQIADARAELEAGRIELNQEIANYTELETTLSQALEMLSLAEDEESMAAAAELQQNLYMVQQALLMMQEQLVQLEEGEEELNEQEKSALAEIASARAQIEEGYRTIEEGEAEIAENEQKLYDAQEEIESGWEEYYEGEEEAKEELSDGWDEYNEGEAELTEKLADAQKEIDDIETATWYVQDRSSLNGYANIESDSDSIEAIARVFPVVFLAVAILISLTTVSRMVDEDRGLIGTYKSLGFTDNEIRGKYLIYAGAACLFGSALGSIFAFFGLPLIVFQIFGVMYLITDYSFWILPVYGITGPLLFLAGILIATWRACYKQLRHTPATLMRPKSPRRGQRVFIEKITPIWNHLSFLNKVTARNIFRYKGRMFMTIFGVGGCMALLLFAFAIQDSVTDLLPRQYEQTSLYDIMVVAGSDDNENLLTYIDDENVADYLNVEITSVKLKSADGSGRSKETSAQVIVVPDGADLSPYVNIERASDDETLYLAQGDIYITRNAGDVLGFDDGDTVIMQLLDLTQSEITCTALVKNYMSNYVYMSASTFEALFEEYEPNGVLLSVSDSCEDEVAFANELEKKDGIVSCISAQEMTDDFSDAFLLVTMVVYLLIVMSAALAFTVLFTLSTTNISEREREIATIKVLGFHDREVHAYINKETFILTGIGILVGIPVGYFFAQTLTLILRLPSIYLAVSLHTVSYLYSVGLTIIFAIAVSFITNRSLNRVDPATALKSVE